MNRRALVFLGAGLAALAGCRRAAPAPVAEAAPVAVRTFAVVAERRPALVEMPATVRPAERATLATRLPGSIATLPVALGQSVAAGEVLLTLSVPEIEARVRQAQAQFAEAERNAARQRTLVTSGVNPPDSLRDAEDRLKFAQAAVAEAEAQFSYATLRAPFAGVITEKKVLPGDLAAPGVPLLVLESTQRLRAEGSVPEKAAAALRPGVQVSVLLDDASDAVTGTIEEISAAADAVSRSVLVKVALPAGAARSGQFARLQIGAGTTDVVAVPRAAVTRFGQMERVWVVVDGRATLQLVQTGRARNDHVEVIAGLAAGDVVVLTPPASLRESQRIVSQP